MSRQITGKKSHQFGIMAEAFAAFYLRMKGYKILAQRFKTPVGEIDLVARRGKIIAFIEVKARDSRDAALTAVTPKMHQRLFRAGEWYITRHPDLSHLSQRLDLIAIAPPLFVCHVRDIGSK